MPLARTFRLFVSSTFEDLEAERNALHELVYPELRAFCAERNARFQPIDLRWGVRDEASLDQQTMNICLGEIKRCHEVTPRPNFLVLLGNRYGWLPPPPQIPKDEFERIRERVPEAQRRLLDWYRLDENADPPEYQLRPRTKAPHDDGEDYTRMGPGTPWARVETELQAVLAAAAQRVGLDEERGRVYTTSATEQEIRAGALSERAADDQAICIFREITGADPAAVDEDDPLLKFMDRDQGRLNALKTELSAEPPTRAIVKYDVNWDGQRPTTRHLDDLVRDAKELLKGAIERELREPLSLEEAPEHPPRFRDDEKLDAEGKEHRKFAEERARIFEGREGILRAIADYLRGEDDERPLVVHGTGGTGKSALLAESLARAQDEPGELVYRFIGATPDSSSGRALLASLSRELARRGYGEGEASVPEGYQDVVGDFRQRLERAADGPRLYLFLDSLDQLSPADGARSLTWLPTPLPAGVRVVASTRPGDTLEPLARRQARLEQLGPLSRDEGGLILDRWLVEAGRDLRGPGQRDAVLDGFESSEGNPLWLRLAFEEARRWRSDEGIPKDLALGIVLEDGPSTEGIIGTNTYPRLADEDNHGEVLVSRALGYLAAARYGLAEDELLDLLSRDSEVYRWFVLGIYHVPPDLLKAVAAARNFGEDVESARVWVSDLREKASPDDSARPDELDEFLAQILPADAVKLPVVLWSRLFADLSPYLSERSVEGGSLISFYHRELGDVARDAYLAGAEERACHARLAAYFRRQADPELDGSWTGDSIRGLSELPYHLTQSPHAGDESDERWQELTDTLTDFRFLERKAAEVGVVTAGGGEEESTTYTGVFSLQEDYALALEKMPGNGGRDTAARKPLIVTAVDFRDGDGLRVGCPWCNTRHPFEEGWRGDVIPCPSCTGPLKVNPFVVGERST